MMKNCDGAEILLEAHSLITGDRQKQYAHPLEDFTQARDIFAGMTGVALTFTSVSKTLTRISE